MSLAKMPRRAHVCFMKHLSFLAPLAFAAACVSCQKAEEPDAVAGERADTNVMETCPADDYQGFVGSNIAAVTYPSDLRARVQRPGTVVTMEYDPTRMNIHVDEDGVITKVNCG